MAVGVCVAGVGGVLAWLLWLCSSVVVVVGVGVGGGIGVGEQGTGGNAKNANERGQN